MVKEFYRIDACINFFRGKLGVNYVSCFGASKYALHEWDLLITSTWQQTLNLFEKEKNFLENLFIYFRLQIQLGSKKSFVLQSISMGVVFSFGELASGYKSQFISLSSRMVKAKVALGYNPMEP